MKSAKYMKTEENVKVPAGHICVILPATHSVVREYTKKNGQAGKTTMLGQETEAGFIPAELGNGFSGVAIEGAPNVRLRASAIISTEKAVKTENKPQSVKLG